jgi:Family of unknown function (DUF5317)
MFILYAIPIGIGAGYLLGGRLQGLGDLHLRWVPVMLIGLAIQLAIFSDIGGQIVGDRGPAIYIASTAVVFIAVLRNIAVPGVALIAVGAASNLAAIAANGGWMPADPAALASVGGLGDGYTNSIVVPDPALAPLTDQFALPSWLPWTNVFSVGDVLIGLGVAVTIAIAMRQRSAGGATEASSSSPSSTVR